MEQIVKGCVDCPYCFEDEYGRVGTKCMHINSATEKVKYQYGEKGIVDDSMEARDYIDEKGNWLFKIEVEKKLIGHDEDFSPITPDWCPLKKEPITILIK